MANLFIVVFLALVAVQQLVAGAELGDKRLEALDSVEKSSEESNDSQQPLIPMLVLNKDYLSAPTGEERASEKPDYFLVWFLPWENFWPQPVKDMVNTQISPQTQQMSEQLSNIPGMEQWYQAVSQVMSTFSGLTSSAGGSGGSASGLGGMFGRR